MKCHSQIARGDEVFCTRPGAEDIRRPPCPRAERFFERGRQSLGLSGRGQTGCRISDQLDKVLASLRGSTVAYADHHIEKALSGVLPRDIHFLSNGQRHGPVSFAKGSLKSGLSVGVEKIHVRVRQHVVQALDHGVRSVSACCKNKQRRRFGSSVSVCAPVVRGFFIRDPAHAFPASHDAGRHERCCPVRIGMRQIAFRRQKPHAIGMPFDGRQMQSRSVAPMFDGVGVGMWEKKLHAVSSPRGRSDHQRRFLVRIARLRRITDREQGGDQIRVDGGGDHQRRPAGQQAARSKRRKAFACLRRDPGERFGFEACFEQCRPIELHL